MDVESNDPLKDVVVMIVDTSDVIRMMQMTDSSGVFVITGIKQELFKVRTYRYGYVSTITGPYDLTKHDTLSMVVRLEAVPLTLSGEVVVTATRTIPYLDRVHFYERKKMGMGHYISYNDFKDRGLTNVYEIFRTIPGLMTRYDGVYFTRYLSSSMGANTPQPSIYVDGMLMPNEPNSLFWLNPENVLAVEVYRDSEAPLKYKTAFGGVILIWTKDYIKR